MMLLNNNVEFLTDLEDQLTVSEFYDTHFYPEISLMKSMLRNAVLDLSKTVDHTGKEKFEPRIDALEWFLSEEEEYLLSYRNVCYVLGLDHEFILELLSYKGLM